MKLVTFGIDDKRNLIVQFPVFVHPQNQQHLTLYQLETVLVPITGGSHLSRTVVKLDSRLARIFVDKFLCIIKLIIIIGYAG